MAYDISIQYNEKFVFHAIITYIFIQEISLFGNDTV